MRTAAQDRDTRPKDPLLEFARTDTGNAERLVHSHSSRLRHVYAQRRWYVWDGRHWCPDTTGRVVELMKDTLHRTAERALKQGNSGTVVDFMRVAQNRTRLMSAIALAQSDPAVVLAPDQLDPCPWHLNVLNGTLDLRSGELLQHDPGNLITKLVLIEYDRQAECPQFERFITETTCGDEELALYLQQLLGMALTGDVSEQILPVFFGAGANGKSTLLDVVLKVMGPYAALAAPELLVAKKWSSHPTEIADLHGRRLIVASETERGQAIRTAFVKTITGDTRLKGRLMRGDFFEFQREFKTILCTNHLPEIRDSSPAIWRRLRVVPFKNVVPPAQQDAKLLQRLKNEQPGILAWQVRGCLSWLRHRLITPRVVEQSTATYRAESDHLERFATEALTFDESQHVTSTDIREAYEQWCRDFGMEPRPNELWERLPTWGCQRRRTKHGRLWQGVFILPQDQEAPQ